MVLNFNNPKNMEPIIQKNVRLCGCRRGELLLNAFCVTDKATAAAACRTMGEPKRPLKF